MCLDYHELNAVVIREINPLSRMNECIDFFGDIIVFSILDASWGYLQMPVAEDHKEKSTVLSHSRTDRCNRMPFGLMNTPTTFRRGYKFYSTSIGGTSSWIT